MNFIKKQKVGVNDFVRRQIEGSGKTYSKTMTFEDIAKHAEEQMIRNDFSEGYRKDILVVNRDYELYLLGTTLDWEKGAFKSEFTITNPNSKSSCGCGESFSI